MAAALLVGLYENETAYLRWNDPLRVCARLLVRVEKPCFALLGMFTTLTDEMHTCTASPAPAAEYSGGFTCYYFELGFFVDPPAGPPDFFPEAQAKSNGEQAPQAPLRGEHGHVRAYLQ